MPVEKQKLVIILRGLPGSGKSFIARNYLSKISDNYSILTADDYFYENKVYKFDKDKIEEAHKWNFERFKGSISDGKDLIIVDNTNIKRFHYYHYLDYAQSNNYLAIVTIVPANDVDDKRLSERNIHGISAFMIRKMRRAFEWEI
jgi:tRNA uridine 5-carbamoylmethylation protein Kti12